mmetsp:Transcript_25496/g.61989  ORF Transcript_25496/g.61989 Transcript_25496/m.61989 type:complete len:135 (-) Transcript_25496:28-432(-)
MSVAEYSGYRSHVQHVLPDLERGGAAFYFSGHSHTLQHLTHNGVHYVVSGCGAVVNYNRWNWMNVPRGAVRFCYPDSAEADARAGEFSPGAYTRADKGGFVFVELFNATHARADYYDHTARVVYSVDVRNPRAP